MKKILCMLIILSALFFTATAQDQPADKMENSSTNKQGLKHGKKDRKKMMKEMDLSKQQKMEMKEFVQSNKARKEQIQNDKSLSDQEKKQKLIQLRKGQQGKMSTILTPDQREKLKEKMMENRNKSSQ